MQMNRQGTYGRQVQLLVQTLPLIFKQRCFALKGGTAINLFVRNLPRLSVEVRVFCFRHSGLDPESK